MFSYNLQLYFQQQIEYGSWEERLLCLHETPVDNKISCMDLQLCYEYACLFTEIYILVLVLGCLQKNRA